MNRKNVYDKDASKFYLVQKKFELFFGLQIINNNKLRYAIEV